ncbi:hypothetical protein [Oceanicella actignis]|uniref:Phage tail tube protein n=1 Tax=Oceanicella actignis TaxID=1189325 RepID=A0A1M7U1P4_9RHOB|nr:hypothetical protein [Oceanicella actignis]SES76711.1 hypothetical protein SAMN04488119_101401 [Oceanicella actignis]SHN76919.1 hypothetical protein SAMN05216200_11421 [Oceanicella actignis]
MAFYSGRDGVVKAGPGLAAVGEVQSWKLDTSAAFSEAWGMGDLAARHFQSAPPSSTGSVEVYFDPADAGQAVLNVGDEVPLELYPGGDTQGTGYFSLSALIESVSRSGSKTDVVALSINFRANGAVTEGTVA